MYSSEIKIPKERVAILIGKNGKTKNLIEKKTKIILDIDSKEGIAVISDEDSVKIYLVEKIIKAIARGFNPDIALSLLKEDNSFELIDINDFSKSKNRLKVLRGRIIGTQGKARNILERVTDTSIEVYGKTVGIIGELNNVTLARQAVINLLNGSKHANVYAWLEKQKKKLY